LEVLGWITAYIAQNKHAPTLEEIGKGLRMKSLATVQASLWRLREKGLLTWQHNVARSIRVTGDRCPTCGRGNDAT
jgi:SOS-response transcriptional repressor LexA